MRGDVIGLEVCERETLERKKAEVLAKLKDDRARKLSPWMQWEEAMQVKVAVCNLFKLLPISIGYEIAFAQDDITTLNPYAGTSGTEDFIDIIPDDDDLTRIPIETA